MRIVEDLRCTLHRIGVFGIRTSNGFLLDNSLVLGSTSGCDVAGSPIILPDGLFFNDRGRTWAANHLLHIERNHLLARWLDTEYDNLPRSPSPSRALERSGPKEFL